MILVGVGVKFVVTVHVDLIQFWLFIALVTLRITLVGALISFWLPSAAEQCVQSKKP